MLYYLILDDCQVDYIYLKVIVYYPCFRTLYIRKCSEVYRIHNLPLPVHRVLPNQTDILMKYC